MPSLLERVVGRSANLEELLAAAAHAAHVLYVDAYSDVKPNDSTKRDAAGRLHRAIRQYDGRD
jgi:hypothetical protein